MWEGNRGRERTYREEEITDVVGNVNREPHVRKVEAITQPDQRQRHDMMPDQLPKILPRLLQLHTQHDRLLRPITRLEQVIGLEHALVGAVRETFKHALGVEIPDRRPGHDVEAQGAEDEKVHGRVDLLHEAVLLRAGFDARGEGERANQALHEEFPCEGEDDDVEGYEGEVAGAFAVVGWCGRVMDGVGGDVWVVAGEGVGEEEGTVEGVGRGGVDEVEG